MPELRRKILYYLSHEEERRRIVLAAHALVKARHSWDARAKFVTKVAMTTTIDAQHDGTRLSVGRSPTSLTSAHSYGSTHTSRTPTAAPSDGLKYVGCYEGKERNGKVGGDAMVEVKTRRMIRRYGRRLDPGTPLHSLPHLSSAPPLPHSPQVPGDHVRRVVSEAVLRPQLRRILLGQRPPPRPLLLRRRRHRRRQRIVVGAAPGRCGVSDYLCTARLSAVRRRRRADGRLFSALVGGDCVHAKRDGGEEAGARRRQRRKQAAAEAAAEAAEPIDQQGFVESAVAASDPHTADEALPPLRIVAKDCGAGFFALLLYAVNQLIWAEGEAKGRKSRVEFGRRCQDGRPNRYYDGAKGPNVWEYYF